MFELPKGFTSADAIDARAGPISASRLERNLLSTRMIKSRQTADPYAVDTFGPHTMTGVNITHSKGLLGKGIKVRHSPFVLHTFLIEVIDRSTGFWSRLYQSHPRWLLRRRLSCIVRRIISLETHLLTNSCSFGYDLVGDAYNGENTPVPGGEKGPFTDCNEHGFVFPFVTLRFR